MIATIQEALQAVKGPTADDLRVFLNVLGCDGFTVDKPVGSGSAFLGLDAETYRKDTLSMYQRNCRCAVGLHVVTAQLHVGASCPWSWTRGLLLVLP